MLTYSVWLCGFISCILVWKVEYYCSVLSLVHNLTFILQGPTPFGWWLYFIYLRLESGVATVVFFLLFTICCLMVVNGSMDLLCSESNMHSEVNSVTFVFLSFKALSMYLRQVTIVIVIVAFSHKNGVGHGVQCLGNDERFDKFLWSTSTRSAHLFPWKIVSSVVINLTNLFTMLHTCTSRLIIIS